MLTTMISLKNAKIIGRGEDRIVYQDPVTHNRCIKISRVLVEQEFNIRSIRDWLFWLSRGCNIQYFDYNFIDVLYVRFLQKQKKSRLFDHLPKCYGFVDTDMGKGVAWELICNSDGSPCISLRDCHLQPEILGVHQKKLLRQGFSDFFKWQLKHHIMLREMGLINTLVRQINNSKICLYHIDTIGCVDIIPLALHADWFADLRIRSKIHSFKKKKLAWLYSSTGKK